MQSQSKWIVASYQLIKVIRTAKLLGIHFDGKLNLEFTVNTLIKKLSKNNMFLQEFVIIWTLIKDAVK